MAKQILYFSTSVAFKTSLILLYYRIFGLVRWFRYVLILAEAIVACYFLACFFAAVFECNPVSYYWDKSIPGGSCIKGTQFYRWNGVANLLIDLMILSITFPMVWGLSISLRQKATLSGVFALGMLCVSDLPPPPPFHPQSNQDRTDPSSSVFIASILRVTSFEQLRVTDQTYTGVAPALWSSAEQSLGIVCACLPCLRPLFGRVLSDDDDDDGASDSRSTPLSRLGARKPQTGPGSQGSGAGGGGGGRTTVEGFARLPDDGFVRSGSAFSARVEAGPLTRQVEVGPEEIWKSQSIETRFDAVCLD